MSTIEFDMFQSRQRSDWVRLRTLAKLRWIAILGQTFALIISVQVFDLHIQTGFAAMTVIASIGVNLAFRLIYPENKRLQEREAFFILVFDIIQLSVLLYLTGGLSNPFALLMLAPVTIAATILRLRRTIVLGLIAIVMTTLLTRFSLPIATASGAVLVLPALFQFGFWLAIVIGVVFLGVYARQVTTEMHNMAEALLATQLALSREQKLTDLGGVVAATAHELGTPLATIMLVSGELRNELAKNPDLLEDVDLIHDQAARCREILQTMGHIGKDDLLLHNTPIEALVKEAAAPHLDRGKSVAFHVGPDSPNSTEKQPSVPRRPEIVHGLRNLIQNAVDFANHSVDISVRWSETELRVHISDDGDGFPTSVIGRIGDPFVRRRRETEDGKKRPGYAGMGLGLFIAKTLLERSGAKLLFRNGGKGSSNNAGARIDVIWPLAKIRSPIAAPLGDNQKFDAP